MNTDDLHLNMAGISPSAPASPSPNNPYEAAKERAFTHVDGEACEAADKLGSPSPVTEETKGEGVPRIDHTIVEIQGEQFVPIAVARALQRKHDTARNILIRCHGYMMEEIRRKHLNESAHDGTQSMAHELSTFLDSK